MAGTSKARLDCRAMTYLQPGALPGPPADVRKAFLDSRSDSPARSSVEARSDVEFVDALVGRFVADGLDEDLATSAALQLLTHPTVAARRREPDGASTLVQSAVLSLDDGSGHLQVTCCLRSISGKPPSLLLLSADVNYVDAANEGDMLELVRAVEGWAIDFPMPSVSHPDPLPIPIWAWVGDPRNLGLQEIPPDWRERLRATGAIYGRPPLIAETEAQARQYKIAERADFVVTLPMAKWLAPILQSVTDIETHTLPADLQTFEALLVHVRTVLLGRALAGSRPSPPERPLKSGEVIYHRKVGSSKKFDSFDEGATDPCSHGADGFIPWGGVKSSGVVYG